MRLKCNMCFSDRYVVVSREKGIVNYGIGTKLKATSDTFYIQKNQCLKCNTTTEHKLSYVSDSRKYRYLNIGGNVIQFHRFVFELNNRKLKPGEMVRFRDGNCGNCKPSNLEAIMPRLKKKRVANRKILVCARPLCNHVWRQRGDKEPKTCPKCRSKRWRKE